MWARVSRTEEKLDPIGRRNCSGVSFSAAPRARRLAQELYSKSWFISSGDILCPSYCGNSRGLQNDPSWVKVKPGSAAPAVLFATLTLTVGASGAEIGRAHV